MSSTHHFISINLKRPLKPQEINSQKVVNQLSSLFNGLFCDKKANRKQTDLGKMIHQQAEKDRRPKSNQPFQSQNSRAKAAMETTYESVEIGPGQPKKRLPPEKRQTQQDLVFGFGGNKRYPRLSLLNNVPVEPASSGIKKLPKATENFGSVQAQNDERLLKIEQASEQKNFQTVQRAKVILEKPVEARTEEETAEVISLLKKIKFFEEKKIEDKDMADIVSSFEVQTFSKGENVISYGEHGDCCYIILKGVVSVQIPNTQIEDWKERYAEAKIDSRWKTAIDHRFEVAKLKLRENTPLEQDEHVNSSLPEKIQKYEISVISEYSQQESSSGGMTPQAPKQSSLLPSRLASLFKLLDLDQEEQVRYMRLEEETENPTPWFIEVSKLTPGQSFGELALLNDAKRQATVHCLQECFFAVINRAEFERVLKRIELKHLQTKLQFFKRVPFMSHWTNSQLQRVVYSFSEKPFVRNQTVYAQSEEARWVYIVKTGEFEMFQRVSSSSAGLANDSQRYQLFRKRKGAQNKKEQEELSKVAFASKRADTFVDEEEECKDGPRFKTVRLAIFCEGQMFGEEDVLKNRKFQTCVRCTSTSATLYCIKAELLKMKLGKDDRTWKSIEDRAELKDEESRLKILKALAAGCKEQQQDQTSKPRLVGSSASKYRGIFQKHSMLPTKQRIIDFRKTMKEIVDISNGTQPPDSVTYQHKRSPLKTPLPPSPPPQRSPTNPKADLPFWSEQATEPLTLAQNSIESPNPRRILKASTSTSSLFRPKTPETSSKLTLKPQMMGSLENQPSQVYSSFYVTGSSNPLRTSAMAKSVSMKSTLDQLSGQLSSSSSLSSLKKQAYLKVKHNYHSKPAQVYCLAQVAEDQSAEKQKKLLRSKMGIQVRRSSKKAVRKWEAADLSARANQYY